MSLHSQCRAIGLFIVLGLAAACSSVSTTNVAGGGDGNNGAGNGTGGTSNGAGNDTGGSSNGAGNGTGGTSNQNANPDAGAGLNFTPSNVTTIQPSTTLKSATIDGTCTIDTSAGSIDCLTQATHYTTKTVSQNDVDGTAAEVFLFQSLTLGNNAQVTVVGNRPLVVLAAGPINISGSIVLTPSSTSSYRGVAGGFSSPVAGGTKGAGPGAGGASISHVGAGGGAYCGKGGNTNGGTPYGMPEINPLLGGSSGGTGFSQGGAGGGAIQIVSGESITIATAGVITAGGGGAFFGGNAGGAGGAILLEAPTVIVRGTLAANGGAGSSNSVAGDDSKNASPDAVAAPGGSTTITATNGNPENIGGAGSAASNIDGAAGYYDEPAGGGLGDYGGGGGGGAGRIRINTTSGEATITGTLSPSATTTCVSQGKLQTK